MGADKKIRDLTLELVQELGKFTIQEIQEFKSEQDAELVRINAPELMRIYCRVLCDAVIEKKQEIG